MTVNMRHYVGLDLGERQDYTAIVVIAVEDFPDPLEGVEVISLMPPAERPKEKPCVYHVRHIERVPLGTPYPQVVASVKEFMDNPALLYRDNKGAIRNPSLLVDATGVGVAVTDMLRVAGLRFTSITITGGDSVQYVTGGYRVPARDLISPVKILFDYQRLKIPPGLPMSDTLVRELLNFKVKINQETAHDSYGAWREGEHDDLVYALAMACWYAERNHGPARFRARSYQAGFSGGVF